MTRTVVYVDGFNLYYGRLKGTPYKWLDLAALCRRLLPDHELLQFRYFTARVSPRPDNPQVHLRQQAYLGALAATPNLTVHFGHFLEKPAWMRLYNPPIEGPINVRVVKTEEKGSDVALASHLVADGFEGRYDVAVVISNDSDLVPPIEIVRERLGLAVGVLNPHRNSSVALQKAASFYRPIREGVVAASQLPDEVVNPEGKRFSRPLSWI